MSVCCARCSRVIFLVGCFLAAMFPTNASAQLLAGLGELDLSQISVSQPSIGLYYGIGTISADHTLDAGPAFTPLWSVGPDFNAFVHHRKTELKDIYLFVESGIERFGTEILSARVETNFRRVTSFRQDTDADAVRRQTNLLVFLEAGQEGVITRDVRNKIWDVELKARWPLPVLGDFLFGYKYHTVTSDINPYQTNYSVSLPPPINPSILFPGLQGWGPYVLDGDNPPLPNSEKLNIAEAFRWHGPFIGIRFTNLLAALDPAHSYVEVIYSPCTFGRYEFSWDTGFTGVFGSGKATQNTRVNRKLNSFFEIRSSARFPLIANVSCDVFLKYSRVRMNLSDVERQGVDLEWPAYPAYNAIYNQQANQSISMYQDLFGVGAGLVASFW
jgi:hypothetical protein